MNDSVSYPERKTGEFFVLAWIILAVFLWAYDAMIAPVFWPAAMDRTLSVVVSVFALSKGVRDLKACRFLAADTPNPLGGEFSQADAVDAACRAAKIFNANEIAQKTGLPLPVVNGYIGRLVSEGKIKRQED